MSCDNGSIKWVHKTWIILPKWKMPDNMCYVYLKQAKKQSPKISRSCRNSTDGTGWGPFTTQVPFHIMDEIWLLLLDPSQCLGTQMHFTGFHLCGLEQQVFSTCDSLCQDRTANIVSFVCVHYQRAEAVQLSPGNYTSVFPPGNSSRKKDIGCLFELHPLSKRTPILAKGERDFFKSMNALHNELYNNFK